MKSRICIIWVIGLLLAISSVDAVPDPPAMNPRPLGIASPLPKVRGDGHERQLNSGLSISSLLQVRWIAITASYEPNLPKNRIVLAGFVTDPSPPVA